MAAIPAMSLELIKSESRRVREFPFVMRYYDETSTLLNITQSILVEASKSVITVHYFCSVK